MFLSMSISLLGMFLAVLAVFYIITSNIINCNLNDMIEDGMDEEHKENIKEEKIYLISQPHDVKSCNA